MRNVNLAWDMVVPSFSASANPKVANQFAIRPNSSNVVTASRLDNRLKFFSNFFGFFPEDLTYAPPPQYTPPKFLIVLWARFLDFSFRA